MSHSDVVKISVAREFTRLPGGRYIRLGPNSGEEFRERFLMEPLRTGKSVLVDLDGVRGYGSSFLEEAFGGAVRALGLTPSEALRRIQIKTATESWKLDVEEYIRTATNRPQVAP